jgi:putative effector of murein hydrolase LrgA (UPF0299 family)
MTVQQFWKGLAMLLVSLIVTALSQTPLDIAVLFVTGVSSLLGYIGKNLIFVTATTTITKIISGLFVALGVGLLEYAGLIAVNAVIIWPVLLKVVGSILLTYIVTTFLAPPAISSKQVKKIAI